MDKPNIKSRVGGYLLGLKHGEEQAMKRIAKLEAERCKYREALERVKSLSPDEGRDGSAYGDTDYNSIDVCYGYNLAVSYAREIAEQALNSKEVGNG